MKVFEATSELPKNMQQLMNKAQQARENAYAPYSHFKVGAALQLSSGKIVVGNNQEILLFILDCAPKELLFLMQEQIFQIKQLLLWPLQFVPKTTQLRGSYCPVWCMPEITFRIRKK